jgi:3-polyprenyl-4-hydroxybenzoate decarboxylase
VGTLDADAELGSLALAASDHDPGVCLTGRLGGSRFVVNGFGSARRIGLALGLPRETARRDSVEEFWRRVIAGVAPREPLEAPAGPAPAAVDLRQLPCLGWPPGAEGDLGAGALAVIELPAGEPVVAPARALVIDQTRVSVRLAAPGPAGGGAVSLVLGADPLLSLPAMIPGLTADSAYRWAGGVRGSALRVHRSSVPGLPVPSGELVLEGRFEPEGDVVRITRVRRRPDAVLFADAPERRAGDLAHLAAYPASALLEGRLRAAGLDGLTGVWLPPEGGGRQMAVIGIRQASEGHAARALRLAAGTDARSGGERLVVVVDEDIDVHSLDDVLWALLTRCDPVRDMTPGAGPEGRCLLVDGTKPWAWLERFAESITSPAAEVAARERWGWILTPDAPAPGAVADG